MNIFRKESARRRAPPSDSAPKEPHQASERGRIKRIPQLFRAVFAKKSTATPVTETAPSSPRPESSLTRPLTTVSIDTDEPSTAGAVTPVLTDTYDHPASGLLTKVSIDTDEPSPTRAVTPVLTDAHERPASGLLTKVSIDTDEPSPIESIDPTPAETDSIGTSPVAKIRPRSPRRIGRRIAAPTFIALAVLSLAYWIACLAAAGAGISQLWIWPAAAAFFVVCFIWVSEKKPFARLHKTKWLRVAVASLLALVFCAFGVVEFLVALSMDEKGVPGLDYIIILGAHVRGTEPSPALEWRIERAREYLTENPGTIAVASGGQGPGEYISEAECIRRELVARGISEDRILIEDKSTSTTENIAFSLEIIGKSDEKIGIVTNNFHIWRAVKTARRAGADAVGIAAPFRNLLIIHYIAREFFSTVLNGLSGNM